MTSVGGGMRSAIPPESIPEALHDAPNGPTLPEPLCGGSESDEMARGTTTLAAVSSIAVMISVTLRPPPSLHDVAVQLGLVGLRLRPTGQAEREHVHRHAAEWQLDVRQQPLEHREDQAFQHRLQGIRRHVDQLDLADLEGDEA